MDVAIRGIGYWRQRLEWATLAVAGLDALAYIVASALADWNFGEYVWMLIFFVILPLLGLAVTRWNAKVGAGVLALVLLYVVVASGSYVLGPDADDLLPRILVLAGAVAALAALFAAFKVVTTRRVI